VPFQAVVTNTGAVATRITSLTDSYSGRTLDVCQNLIGTLLAIGESVTCRFALDGYATASGSSLVNTVTVEVQEEQGERTARSEDISTVISPPVDVLKSALTSAPPVQVVQAPPAVAPAAVQAPVREVAAPAAPSTLPFTGGDVDQVAMMALALVLVGGTAVVVGRRRRSAQE
jgi:LPXTG-motif cell wall-anchored protein